MKYHSFDHNNLYNPEYKGVHANSKDQNTNQFSTCEHARKALITNFINT